MHSPLLNQIEFKLSFKPWDNENGASPLLIKKAFSDEMRYCERGLARKWFNLEKATDAPKMAFVRTWRNGRYEPYVPGSSLKGVFRSQAENIAALTAAPKICFTHDNHRLRPEIEALGGKWPPSCSKRLLDADNPMHPYKASCPICRIFGNSKLKGRLLFNDAYSDDYENREPLCKTTNKVKLSVRDGVAIDRFQGGAKDKALYNYEVEESANFSTSLILQNFELWQLGLIAFLLADFEDGLLRFGSGQSKGMGKVRGAVDGIEIAYWRQAGAVLRGVGGLENDRTFRNKYDIWDADVAVGGEEMKLPVKTPVMGRPPFVYKIEDCDQIFDLMQSVALKWVDFIKNWQPPLEKAL